ncbi:MAG: glycosyltransferase family 9 protein [Planctomycetota bacterium]
MSTGDKTPKSGFCKRQEERERFSVHRSEIEFDHDAPRFLISRMSAIGDTILTLPVACALRDHFPNAYIAWAVEEKSAPVVVNHSAVDDVIVLKRGWFTSPRGLTETRRRLRRVGCDVAIDCQGMTKSALACYLSGAEHRIGYAGKHAREFSRLLVNLRVQPIFDHLTDRSLELLAPLGCDSPSVRWDLPIADAARSWASRYRATIPERRLAVLNPGATWHSKQWLPERFGATARYLADQYGYRSVAVWGTAHDRDMAAEIVATSGGAALLAPETDLQHLAAMIETGDLFISNDTGPLHMAVAVGARTIGLYGATRPGDCGPYGQTAIQKAYESGSARQRRSAPNTAMRAIEVQDVCDAIDLIEKPQQLLAA